MNKEKIISCDLCGKTNFKSKKRHTESLGIKSEEKYDILACKSCNLYFLSPIPNEEEFLEIYENYAHDGDRINVENKRKKTIYPERFNLIRKYSKNEGKSLLDIGAGNGGFLSTAIDQGFEATGIELEPEQVKLAQKTYGISLTNIKFEEFVQGTDKTFDVIHMHHVFEHVQSPSQTLTFIHKILNNNGILILEVPNQFFKFPKHWLFRLGLIQYEKPYNPYHHLYFYSRKTLISYMEKHGFEILELNHLEKGNNFKSRVKNTLAKLFNESTSHALEVVATKKNVS